MTNQVLSIEQMQELKELGIDTSKASMCYVENEFTVMCNDDYALDYSDEHGYDIMPTFTLQDILEMLPEIINYDGSKRLRVLPPNKVEYTNAKLEGHFKCADTLINTSFEMLKWCKQNNYI